MENERWGNGRLQATHRGSSAKFCASRLSNKNLPSASQVGDSCPLCFSQLQLGCDEAPTEEVQGSEKLEGGFIKQDAEQCGVDGYGSMKAFWRIRHKSQQILYEIRPRILETRINEQDDQIAYLEEEGTSLRERVNNMEQGIDSLKLRMRVLEVANAFKSTEILSGEASFA
ncbi:hypothetical protein SUGI_1107080 [Cryptomeria japonica]|nr:hypothetical protein SUGI_1107080 [Cryptomeria japonica]